MKNDEQRHVLPEEEPILADLAELGFRATHIQDLYNENREYRAALPMLVGWIPRVTDPAVKEMLVWAVTDPGARGFAGPVLVRLFESEWDPDESWSGFPWTIGNAIEAVAEPSILPDMSRISSDKRYGRARERVVAGLGRIKHPDAVHALIELLDDPDVGGIAVMALARLKPPEARAPLERFVDDDRGWVRAAARRAIREIDRREGGPTDVAGAR